MGVYNDVHLYKHICVIETDLHYDLLKTISVKNVAKNIMIPNICRYRRIEPLRRCGSAQGIEQS